MSENRGVALSSRLVKIIKKPSVFGDRAMRCVSVGVSAGGGTAVIYRGSREEIITDLEIALEALKEQNLTMGDKEIDISPENRRSWDA
jgi:hypothetical protein